MNTRDAIPWHRGAKAAAAVTVVLLGVFLINILLGFARATYGLDVAPFLGKVAEFLTLFLSAAAFGATTWLRERARDRRTGTAGDQDPGEEL